mgnify:CR=1 FL=1
MKYEEMVSLLGYAGDHEQPVRITLGGATEVVGVPTGDAIAWSVNAPH